MLSLLSKPQDTHLFGHEITIKPQAHSRQCCVRHFGSLGQCKWQLTTIESEALLDNKSLDEMK